MSQLDLAMFYLSSTSYNTETTITLNYLSHLHDCFKLKNSIIRTCFCFFPANIELLIFFIIYTCLLSASITLSLKGIFPMLIKLYVIFKGANSHLIHLWLIGVCPSSEWFREAHLLSKRDLPV